jgi:hypothetical protein
MFQPSAVVIADSINKQGCRLTTFALTYHRYIHSEIMTYRMWSRNASSSRAIPVIKNINHVESLDLYPLHWGATEKGMQAYTEVDEATKQQAMLTWDYARENALVSARKLVELGIHKQVVNRLLEPFNTITTLVTATDYSNFFTQRCHEAAQPEIRVLAEAMEAAYNESLPADYNKYGWHLPYVSENEIMHHLDDFATLIKLSVGRCCRVSYLQHDGTRDLQKDIALHDYLATALPPHLSPFEHVAQNMDDTEMYANLQGWQSRRWKIEHNVIGY